MLKSPPNSVDVADFQFKLKCRVQVFENKDSTLFSKHCNLVACASRFGLIFVGSVSSNFQVIQHKDLQEFSNKEISNYPRRIIQLPSPPKYLSVNCEHTILAVVFEKDNCPCARFYDLKSFWRTDVVQLEEVRLSPTPGIYIVAVDWNPALAAVFTACKSDGSLGVYEIKTAGIQINELPPAAGATNFCWSPKGKQIAVGSLNGKITQYKPDLKAVKVINAPPLKQPHSVISLCWVSNYQFVGVYQPNNPDESASVIVVDAPKTGDPCYTNYDDICYSNGTTRPPQFYMILQHAWNILLIASSNSMEVGVMGSLAESWAQWTVGDAARAELPLNHDHQETLPVGCDLDIASTQPIVFGESTLPPAPILIVLSNCGTLCCFNVLNMKEGVPLLCTPPDAITDSSGIHCFTTNEDTPQIKPTKTVNSSTAVSAESTINLFGGQVTLTPVARTYTPPTQPTVVYEISTQPKPIPPPAVAFQLPTTPKIIPVASLVPTPQPKAIEPSLEQILAKQPEITLREEETKTDEAEEALLSQMIREECIYLESSLQAILHQSRSLKINLGTDVEKTNIVTSTTELEEYFKEVLDICTSQTAEVHVLKQHLLQSWAWYEEAKSRHLASNDASITLVLRTQPLDPASEKQLADITYWNSYLESQIAQAHRALDEQWERFQDDCRKKHKIQLPPLNMIFVTLEKQSATIQKQIRILKEIGSRIQKKSRAPLGPSPLRSIEDVEDLDNEVRRLRLDPEDISQLQYEHVLNRTKSLTTEKSEKLKSFLKNRQAPHISVVKTQLASSILQSSPPRKFKQQLSLLGAKMSPVFKENVAPRKLEFVQSTPKPTLMKGDPIEGLQNLAVKFQADNTRQFAPFAKALGSSPNSAFVATSVASTGAITVTSKTSTAATTTPQALFKTSNFTMNPSQTVVSKSVSSIAPQASSHSNTTATVTKPAFTFNLPPSVTIVKAAPTTSIFGNSSSINPSSSVFNTTASPGQPISPLVKGITTADSSKTVTTTTSIFGSLSSPTTGFSFDSAGNIFGNTSHKITEGSKPFSFGAGSNKTVPTPISISKTTTGISATAAKNVTPTTASSLSSLFQSEAAKQPLFGASAPSRVIGSLLAATTSPPASAAIKPTLSTTESAGIAGTANGTAKSTSASSILSSASLGQSTVFGTSKTPSFGGVSSVTHAFGTTASAFGSSTPSITPATKSSIFETTASSTTQSSVLGAAIPSTEAPIFGASHSTTPQAPVFGDLSSNSSQPSVFGAVSAPTSEQTIFVTPPKTTTTQASLLPSTTTAQLLLGTAATNTPSVFRSVETLATTQQSIFGSTGTSTTQSSIFGGAVSQSSSFGASSQPSVFGATATATAATPSDAFGSAATPAATPSVFGSAATPPVTPSVFGSAATSDSTSSVFGSAATSGGSAPSVFGSAATSGGGTPSVFGSAATSGGSTPSVFGSAATSAGTPSIFGAAVTSAATPSVFGSAVTSAATPPVFGSAVTSAATPSVFGSAVTSAATPSVFGSAVTSAAPPSVFGSAVTPAGTPSVFGSAATPPVTPSAFDSAVTSTAPSVFGAGATPLTTQSIFGASTATLQPTAFGTSIFGATSPTTTQSSVFGGNGQTVFGAATNQQFGSSTFGAAAAPFGQSSSPFDASKSNTTSVFGQSAGFGNASGTFGGGASGFGASSQPTFGQSGSVFGGTSTNATNSFGSIPTTSSSFGPSASVFGAPVSSSSSPFGTANVFASTASQPNAFTSSTGAFGFGGLNVGSTVTTTASSSFGFGQTPTTNPFATGQKSVFGGENKSVFGSPTATSTNSVFGSSGATSPFGGTPQTFGSSSFGGQSTFGQPQQSVFGQSTFGTNSFGQQSPGPFSGGAGSVAQSGFGGAPSFQKPSGFGGAPVFGAPAPAFGSNASFGGASSFGSSPSFGETKVFGSGSSAFGNAAAAQSPPSFGNLANQPTGFANLAQQSANTTNSNSPFSGGSSFSSWR